MADHGNGGAIGAATTVRFTLDQVVRLVVVVAIFCIGWLYRAQEQQRAELKEVRTVLEANAVERQQMNTKIEVIDKVGQERLSNLTKTVDRAADKFEKLVDEQRRGKGQ